MTDIKSPRERVSVDDFKCKIYDIFHNMSVPSTQSWTLGKWKEYAEELLVPMYEAALQAPEKAGQDFKMTKITGTERDAALNWLNSIQNDALENDVPVLDAIEVHYQSGNLSNKLAVHFDTLLSALQTAQPTDDWKPIKKAKKDGTRYLIPDNGGTVVYWEKKGNENQGGKPGWTNGYFDSHYEENYIFNPTVFRELDLPNE